MTFSLSEKTIEDILSADKTILSEILGVNPSGFSLIARQKILPSGKLDLLCMYDNALILVELKITPFYSYMVDQINDYYRDLQDLQKQNKLIKAPIQKILIVTSHTSADIEYCEKESIRIFPYKPEEVLAKYFENFKELSYYLTLQSGDFGVVRLGLLNTTLKLLGDGKTIAELSQSEDRAIKTIKNRLSIASLLGLVNKYKSEYFLTELGASFVDLGEPTLPDRLTDEQSKLLSNFVKESPFYSQITYTILSFLETIFILAKSSYPVEKIDTEKYFVKTVGKEQTWRTPKARRTAIYIFSNYACELQFLAMIGGKYYITPNGIQAILLLQLNRSIKLIESQNNNI